MSEANRAFVSKRAGELYDEARFEVYRRTDRVFAGLMVFQWVAAIVAALVLSPLTWIGATSQVHLHVWGAVLVGGAITFFPVFLALTRPGETITRHTIAVAQMLFSALLIHVSGGRIETHFHVFGSLAFVAFYRDWRVLVSATLITAVDHIVRGVYWPQSIYGVLTGAEWRWVEHAGWVVFEDLFLIASCRRGDLELRQTADRRAELEWNAWLRSGQSALDDALRGLRRRRELGQAALSTLGGLLRAPLAACYLRDPSSTDRFELVASLGFTSQSSLPRSFGQGEGLLGEVTRNDGLQLLSGLEAAQVKIAAGLADLVPKSLLLCALVHEGECQGALAFASLEELGAPEVELLEVGRGIVGSAVASARARQRTETLLAESQHLAHELRRQNDEVTSQRAELDRKNQELVEASRHKSAFLASMSHELRTPLNAMIGYTSLSLSTLRPRLEAKEIGQLERAETAARTLLGLLNSVLDFSKIEAGHMEVYGEPIVVEDVIEESSLTAEGLLIERPVELKTEVEEGLPEIESDFTRLKQVLNNLLGNAIKATETGHVSLEARHGEDGGVVIAVEDTGCGIPPEKLDTIFEAFKQIDDSSRKRFAGTGLGLAITKRLCDLMGIEIAVQSQVGVGTRFELHLPRTMPEQPLEPDSAPAAAPTPLSGAPKPVRGTTRQVSRPIAASRRPEPSGKPLPLICLGSEALVEGLTRCLSGFPLEPRRAKDLAQAVSLASEEAPWAIVVEPDASGFESLNELSEQPALRRVPIVMCAEELGGFQLDRVQALVNPFSNEELVDALLNVDCWRKGEVLVVEDDGPTRELYAAHLSEAGYTPRLVGSGEEALASLREGPRPQAIVLDLLMPQMDGFELMAALQDDAALRRIPVMVVTGKDLSGEERARVEQGCELLIRKGDAESEEVPGRLENMVAAVQRAGAQRVLVVDDNEPNRDLIGQLFAAQGYTVHTAEGGAAAIELALAKGPDVVIMDLAMPGMDGFEATQMLRAHPATQDTAIIACSAFALDEFRKRALDAGCDGFITKPIEPAELVDRVKRLVLTAKVRRNELQLVGS